MNSLWRLALKVAYRILLIYWFLFRPTEQGVYVAIWCRGRVLLIRNSYKPGDTFPAGRVKQGEDLALGACREVEEEVGIVLQPADLRCLATYESRCEYKLDQSTVFEVELAEEPEVQIDQREVVYGAFHDPDEVRDADWVPIVRQYFAARRSEASGRGSR